MIIIGILLFVILNIYIIIRYYRKGIEIFSPCMFVAVMSLTQLLPQLTTIYFHPHYDKNILYNLLFVMCSCNIALMLGYEYGKNKRIPSKPIWDLKIEKMDIPIFILSLFGFFATFMYMGKINNADWVVATQFEALGIIGLSLGLVKAYKGHTSKLLYVSLVVASIPIAIFAFVIKGSRNNTFLLLVMWLLYWALKKKESRKMIAQLFMGAFLLGGIASLSIIDIRHQVVHGNDSFKSIAEIDYLSNFKNAFTNSYTPVGMDLGNAAEGIDYCFKNDQYNFGLFLWNGFVFNYVPRRIVGEETKNELMSDLENIELKNKLCKGVTCMTGYYDAFSAFSYFGFILYFIIGFFYGRSFYLAQFSSFYLFLYLFLLNSSAIIMTHGIQLMVARVEFLFILVIPLLLLCKYIKKIYLRHEILNKNFRK